MKVIKSILVATAVIATLSVKAQTVDDIANKHIAAIGGKEVLSQIKSMILESEVTVMGQGLSSLTTIVVNKGFKNVTTFNGMEIIQCFTPDGGWALNPMVGSTTAEPLTEEQRKAGASTFQVGGPLYNYKEKGNTVELAGRDSVNGVSAYKLVVKDKNGIETTLFIDPTTYYVLKQQVKATVGGQEVNSTSTFADFKKTDIGLVMPFTTNSTNQGFEITISHTKIDFNKEVDPKIFEMPKS